MQQTLKECCWVWITGEVELYLIIDGVSLNDFSARTMVTYPEDVLDLVLKLLLLPDEVFVPLLAMSLLVFLRFSTNLVKRRGLVVPGAPGSWSESSLLSRS